MALTDSRASKHSSATQGNNHSRDLAVRPSLVYVCVRQPPSSPVLIKGRVARDEEHIGTPGSGRVRVILLKTRRRRGASPGPMETTTRSSSKGSVWALPGGTQTEPSPLMGN